MQKSSSLQIHGIRAYYVEEYVLKRIDEVVTHPKVLKKLVDKVNTHKKQMVKPLQEEFERQVKRQNELEASLKGCDSEELSYEYVQEVMSHLNDILQEMPNDEKKAFYHMVIEEIVVNQEKKIEMIKLKIDEEVPRDIIKRSLCEKQSDRDILLYRNNTIINIQKCVKNKVNNEF